MSQPFRRVFEGQDAVGFMESTDMLLVDFKPEGRATSGPLPVFECLLLELSFENGAGFVRYLCG